MNCLWCHNPEGIAGEVADAAQAGERPAAALAGRPATAAQVLAEVEKDRIFYDQSGGGVTFSGGEPTLQPDFLAALLAGCRERALHTALDTCGYAPAARFAPLAAMADLVLFDLKLIDEQAHRRYTGVGVRLIQDNFRALLAVGRPLRVRLPLVPGITAVERNLKDLIAFLQACGSTAPVDLLPYHDSAGHKYAQLGRTYALADLAPPTAAEIETIKTRLTREGFSVTIGGSP